jgi:hypothetical protein
MMLLFTRLGFSFSTIASSAIFFLTMPSKHSDSEKGANAPEEYQHVETIPANPVNHENHASEDGTQRRGQQNPVSHRKSPCIFPSQ